MLDEANSNNSIPTVCSICMYIFQMNEHIISYTAKQYQNILLSAMLNCCTGHYQIFHSNFCIYVVDNKIIIYVYVCSYTTHL